MEPGTPPTEATVRYNTMITEGHDAHINGRIVVGAEIHLFSLNIPEFRADIYRKGRKYNFVSIPGNLVKSGKYCFCRLQFVRTNNKSCVGRVELRKAVYVIFYW